MDFKGKNEEDCLSEILHDFFSKKDIKSRFKFISEKNLFGCEKWIQIELTKYLFEKKNIISEEIVKEECYDTDQRKKDHRVCQFIDLTFKVKNKKYYIALELKHKNHLALAEIDKDFRKTKNIKPNQKVYFRKIFCLLVHPFKDESYIEDKAQNKDNLNGQLEFSFKIPTSELSCTVFSNQLKS